MTTALGLLAGHVLDRYELLLPIAQGGMGTVWAARVREGPRQGRIVAVKTMLPALSNDPRFERMFLAESRIAAKIHHPNVCAVLDQGEKGGVLYFVMEWVDGDSLVALLGGSSSRRQCERIPFAVAARLGIEAARGLHAAHEVRDDAGALIGIVHRDVSPHNILVTRDGHVKIADFGVAKAMAQAEGPTTSTGHMKGKIHFMAPEQVVGDAIDRRTDIFALGIVLYQLTTGIHPFTAGHELATMARITRPEPVDPPSALVPDYPRDLEAVLLRALAKSPDERFGSMAELAGALEAVEAALGDRREEVRTFLSRALAERAEKRAELIAQALLAARGDASDGTPTPTEHDSREDGRRRGRAIATGVALVAGGALLGSAALIWLNARDQGEPSTAAPSATESRADPGPTSLQATASASASAPASASASASAPADALASASAAQAAPPPPSASHAAPGVTPARLQREPGRAKFREPGF